MVVRQVMVMLLLLLMVTMLVVVVVVAMMAVGMVIVIVPAVYWALLCSGPRNAHTISCHPHTRCKMGPIQVNMLIFGAQRGDVTFSESLSQEVAGQGWCQAACLTTTPESREGVNRAWRK